MGHYARSKSVKGPRRSYGFTKPENLKYPQMLGLFSRRLDTLGGDPTGQLSLIPVDGVVSSIQAESRRP